MNVGNALQWLQLILTTFTCIGVIYGVVNIVSRNKREWEKRENEEERRDSRIEALEKEMADIRKDGREIIAIGATLGSLQKEIERVRNRLDSFLDAYAVRPVRDEEAAAGG
jgi:uncharacterized membrane protein YcjF (UPF0283 family)